MIGSSFTNDCNRFEKLLPIFRLKLSRITGEPNEYWVVAKRKVETEDKTLHSPLFTIFIVVIYILNNRSRGRNRSPRHVPTALCIRGNCQSDSTFLTRFD